MANFACLKDFEDFFHNTQAANIRAFFTNGAEREITRQENEDVFKR